MKVKQKNHALKPSNFNHDEGEDLWPSTLVLDATVKMERRKHDEDGFITYFPKGQVPVL